MENRHKINWVLKPALKAIILILFLILISNPITAEWDIIDFSDPEDVAKTYGENTMVKDGKAQLAYTSEGMERFLRGENATLEKITDENASKLNTSDWIYYGDQFFKIVRLKKEYIEDISVELYGTLSNFQSGEFFSTVKIEIKVNESAITSSYPNDNSVLADLVFNYDGKSKTVEYDYEEHMYLFEDSITISGDDWLYPFDRYISQIQVSGGELLEKLQTRESQESGFKLDVYFKKDRIIIEKSRNVLIRYFVSLLILIFLAFILNSHIKNLNTSHMTDKKKIDLAVVILAMLSFVLFFGFGNLNFIKSIGILPFVAFGLFFVYKISKIRHPH